MRRVWLAAAVVAMATLASPLRADAASDTIAVVGTDVRAAPLIRIEVAVPASLAGRDLGAAGFELFENGQRREVQVDPLPADRLEVALVMDTSGSTRGAPLAAAKAAAQGFLASLPATVPVSIVAFGDQPRLVSARSLDRQGQAQAVGSLRAGGETALYDAVRLGLTQLLSSENQGVIVLLSDGGDTSSAATLDQSADQLVESGTSLFAVALDTRESNGPALTRLASESGGVVIQATAPTALAGAFDALSRQLTSRYLVSYRSRANSSQAEVDISVVAGDLRVSAHHSVLIPPGGSETPLLEPGVATDTSSSTPWALLAGAGLCGLAIFVLVLIATGARVPRAKGLARGRSLDLSGAAQRAEAIGDTVLRKGGGHARVSNAIEAAGLDVRPGELFVAIASGTLVLLATGWALAGPIVGLVLAAMCAPGTKMALNLLAGRRRAKFESQLADTLQVLAGGLRAGHGLAQALETVAREGESPTAEELQRVIVEARLGRELVATLSALAERMRSEDFGWVVQAVEIQREVGGDLAEILDTVGSTIRDRIRIRRQVSALSAEGRASAWVLMILPFGLGVIVSATSPDFLSPLFTTGSGRMMLALGAVLLLLGGVWLRRIVKPIF